MTNTSYEYRFFVGDELLKSEVFHGEYGVEARRIAEKLGFAPNVAAFTILGVRYIVVETFAKGNTSWITLAKHP